jgi:hypothetical protein
MSEDRELTARLDTLTKLLDKHPEVQNLNQEFAMHLEPKGDIRVVADRLVEELKKRNCTVYSLNAGRASTGKIAVIVKFREGK